MLLAPPHKFHGFAFMLDAFLAGAFMFWFLRDRGLGRFGSLVGGLSFHLGNSLLTSARQGALWRFDTACWIPLFLLFFTRLFAKDERRLRDAFFAGIALGLQFLGGEVQLAYYVCLLALAYFVTEAAARMWAARNDLRREVLSLAKRTGLAAIVVVVAAVFAAEVFVSYFSFARTNENVGVQTESDSWRFATEFSFPPEETFSLLLTGDIFGDVARPGPAGGKVQRVTDDYFGILVLLFATLGLISERKRRWFFGAAACCALLIAFGKHFPPPYRLVYSLPLMSGLRNPHKWLFISSLCSAILAGMGADYWLHASPQKSRRVIAVIVGFAAVAVGAALMGPVVARAKSETTFSPAALIHPLGFLLAGSLLMISFAGKRRALLQHFIPAALVTLLAADLVLNASKYLVYYNYQERFKEEGLLSYLQAEPEPFRVKVWSESPRLRHIMTETLPFYGIDTVDAIMSRRPPRYSEMFRALRERRLPLNKYLQVFNARFVLSAEAIQTGDVPLRLARRFSANGGEDDSFYLYEFTDCLPRAHVVTDYEIAEGAEIIDVMADPAVDLRRTAVLEKTPGQPPSPKGAAPLDWKIINYSSSPDRVSMEIILNSPGLLILLDYMDDHWRALVDGEDAELLRADYLMRAVALPQGKHDVQFLYSPPIWGFRLTAGMWLVLLLLAARGGIRLWKERRKEPLHEGEA
jgi:hypothetical protein